MTQPAGLEAFDEPNGDVSQSADAAQCRNWPPYTHNGGFETEELVRFYNTRDTGK